MPVALRRRADEVDEERDFVLVTAASLESWEVYSHVVAPGAVGAQTRYARAGTSELLMHQEQSHSSRRPNSCATSLALHSRTEPISWPVNPLRSGGRSSSTRPRPHPRHRHGRRPQGESRPDRGRARARRVVAAVFTRNRFCAAPVQLCREHLAAGAGARAILVNTGNANAGTGSRRARACALDLRRAGPAARLRAGAGAAVFDRRDHGDAAARAHRGRLPAALAAARGPTAGRYAAEAIMTTDTVPKAASLTVQSAARPSPSPASARAPA